ncbi:MAG: ROK family protein, partial [Candidatus Dormibacteraceae bacterium]
ARSAESGDKTAAQAIVRAGSAVGTALASSAHLLDLDATILAGGFSRSGPLFWDALFERFNRLAPMEFARRMEILPSTIWGEACLYGAAAFVLLPEQYGWSIP